MNIPFVDIRCPVCGRWIHVTPDIDEITTISGAITSQEVYVRFEHDAYMADTGWIQIDGNDSSAARLYEKTIQTVNVLVDIAHPNRRAVRADNHDEDVLHDNIH